MGALVYCELGHVLLISQGAYRKETVEAFQKKKKRQRGERSLAREKEAGGDRALFRLRSTWCDIDHLGQEVGGAPGVLSIVYFSFIGERLVHGGLQYGRDGRA